MIGSVLLATTLMVQSGGASAPASGGESAQLADAYFYFLQGCASESDDNLPAAVTAYRKAVALWPSGADIHAELAGVLARTGQTDDAIKEAQSALALDADNRLAHRTLGLVQAGLASSETNPTRASALQNEAIGHLEAVARDRLIDENVQLALARLYVDAGRDALAIDMLRNLLIDAPDSPEMLVLLGQAYEHGRQFDSAIETVQQLTSIVPNQSRVWIWLAELNEQKHDWRAAADIWDRLAARSRDEVAFRSREASALISAGDAPRAVTVLEAARQLDGKNVDLLFNLGAAYDRAGRQDQAERTFREVLAEQPANAETLNYLGYMLADRGTRLDEAVDFIKRALAVEADNPSFLDSLGWAYFKQSKLQQARDPLQRAAAALPANSVVHDHLGELYFKLKQYREAVDAWDRALGGDLSGVDQAAIAQKRDRARVLAR
jgi:tetratricopeptide (TPR) repeat protein